ncbi:MAG: ATP-binding protein [Anaerolineaceae bacterium]|jgi:two-component system phosphate regulon sensor histidine kinase PhoR
MARSLHWRISASYTTLVVISMIILSGLLYTIVRNHYIESLRAQLLDHAQGLSEQAAPLIAAGQPGADLNDLVLLYSNLLDLRITIVRLDGRVIADSGDQDAIMANYLNQPEVSQALTGVKAHDIRFRDALDTEILYVAVPAHQENEIIGAVRLAVSLQRVNQSLAVVRNTIVGISLLTMAGAVLLAMVLGNLTTQPLKRLTNRVLEMSADESVKRAPHAPVDEIRQLSQAFSRLTSRLNKQIEELTSERGKLSAVLIHMTDGVMIVDKDGIVRLVNPAVLQMFATTESEALDRPLIEAVRNHQFVELWRKSQLTGRQHNVILEISPERLFIQGIATPLTESLPDHILLVFQDFTRIRRLEMIRRDFVSNVSHELRTPLASLKALTETLMEGALDDPPAARRFLVRMEHEIDNLTQLVRELLELSRIESGRVPLDRRVISPYELITVSIERMQVQAERAGLKVMVDIPEDIPNVSADSERMEQVLVNLIHNAIKFTSPGGEIKVGAFTQPGKVVFYVHDTGVGISAEALPRIFERFYKADRARSGGGTGLGLSISRHLVEAHDGRIWAQSVPGQGSTFYFSLPIT